MNVNPYLLAVIIVLVSGVIGFSAAITVANLPHQEQVQKNCQTFDSTVQIAGAYILGNLHLDNYTVTYYKSSGIFRICSP